MYKKSVLSVLLITVGCLLASCGNGQEAVNSKSGAKTHQPALAVSQNDKQMSDAVSKARSSLKDAKLKQTSGGASESLDISDSSSTKDSKAESESIKKAAESLASNSKNSSGTTTSSTSASSKNSSSSAASGSAPITVSKAQVSSSRKQLQDAGITRNFSDEDIAKMMFYIANRQASITDAANNADYIIKSTPTVKITK